MSLQHCIIHHLRRVAPGHAVETHCAETTLVTEDTVVSLFEQVKFSFLRAAQKQFGFFNTERHSPLPGWLRDYHTSKLSFFTLSTLLTTHLAGQLNAVDEPFDCHLLISIETVLDEPVLNLIWLEHRQAPVIGSDLRVDEARYVDTGRVAYGLRLHFNEWLEEQTPKYLALLTVRGNKALSQTFEQFSNFSAGLDLKQDTQRFLSIVDAYTQQLPEDKCTPTRNSIMDYCVQKNAQGAPIVVDELSRQLNQQSPSEFATFVGQQQEQPTPVIHTDRSTLKRYVRFFGRDRDMSISFSADRFGDDVRFDKSSGALTLHKLPKALKAQLLEESNKG